MTKYNCAVCGKSFVRILNHISQSTNCAENYPNLPALHLEIQENFKLKKNVRDAKYHKENKPKILLKKKEYYQENRPEILEKKKKHYAFAGKVKYYKTNRPRLLCKLNQYYWRNRMTINKKHKVYNKKYYTVFTMKCTFIDE